MFPSRPSPLSIQGQARGDLLYFNGGAWVRLGVGSVGQVLTTDGETPTWGSGGGGVPGTRQISTTAPLAGGGALSGDLTLSVTVGTTSGTVAAGDDSRITGAAQKSANLSDLSSAASARSNLGLGTMAIASATDYIERGVITTQGDIIIADAFGLPTRLAKGAAGKVLLAGASTVSWESVPAPAGVPTLDTANTWTAPQLIQVSTGSTAPATALALRHDGPGPVDGSGIGQSFAFGGALLGWVHAVYFGEVSAIVLRPTNRYGGGLSSTVGFRVRAATGSNGVGVEVVLSNVDPVIQPTNGVGGDPPTCNLVVQPGGSGVLRLNRAVVNLLRGTVADITGGVGVFAGLTDGDTVIATDAAGGAGALATKLGGSWQMAPLTALST